MGSLEAQLGTLIKGAVGEAVQEAVDKALPKALAALRMPARPAEQEEKYLSREEAAAIANYHERTISRAIAEGSLQAVGLHRDRIAPAELHRWMAAGARGRRRPAAAHTPANEAEEINAEVDRLLNDEK
jgi:hypothetical protein